MVCLEVKCLYVHQVCLDAERICGKKLSMPTDAFKHEFCRDMTELKANGSLKNMLEQFNGRVADMSNQAGISLPEQG